MSRSASARSIDFAISRRTKKDSPDWATNRTVPIEEVVEWLELHSDRPSFVYIHTMEPHSPFNPPEGFNGTFSKNHYKNITTFQQTSKPAHMKHLFDRYDEEVLYADHRLGEFVDALKAISQ